MKRDWDVIRELLTKLEERDRADSFLTLAELPAEGAAAYSYNMELLLEAELVEGSTQQSLSPGPIPFLARRLTWKGHEFLDAVRSDTVWNRTKTSIAEQGLSMTFDLVKTVASRWALSLIPGLPS